MKIMSCTLLALLAAGALSACGTTVPPAASATSQPPPPAVTGVITPKAVSVVTAN
jgi:ABC-type glycerol-3-phosphate transport system substrate-binding protein